MSPSCPGGIAEPGRAIFSHAPSQLGGFDEGQWVSRRAAGRRPAPAWCWGRGSRPVHVACAGPPPRPKRQKEVGLEKLKCSDRAGDAISFHPHPAPIGPIPCSREDGARFAQAPPLPPTVQSLGKPGLNIVHVQVLHHAASAGI